MLRDINERVENEIALRDANAHLQNTLTQLRQTQTQIIQQERLRALGTMASGIAHDFNNARAPILGYTDLLLNHPDILRDEDKVTQWLLEMNTAAKDGAEVVSRMREFYRYREDTEVMAPTDLNKVVRDAVALTQPRWKDIAQSKGVDIEVRTELVADLPLIAGNEANLHTVLTNLLINGADAMPEGGVLTVSTRSVGDVVELRVSDTGTGMTEDVQRRALEPFFTTKGEHGSGLGLAMVHGIIERHRGQMEIETELGRGTTFVITLPQGPAGSETVEPLKGGEPIRSLHVLVVEDETIMQNVLSAHLETGGHSVEVASDGLEGFEKFKAGGFDLVITDRAMPDMNGDQLVEAIRGMGSNIPIVMLTGFGDMMEAAEESVEGVDLVVNKPVTESTLREAISKVVGD